MADSISSALLEHWNLCRKNLDDAIRVYLETSVTLATALSRRPDPAPSALPRQTVIDAVYLDFNSFESRYKDLGKAQSHLAKIRNRSASQIPFNKLPTEIIIRIFQDAATGSCVCSTSKTLRLVDPSPKTLFVLPQVCAHWREIAINTPLLWSRITFDLKRDGDFRAEPSRPHLWLERARDAPLYIHLDSTGPNSRLGESASHTVAQLLRPCLKNITGFCIEAYWSLRMVNSLFSSLLAHENADSMREFIQLGYDTKNRQLEWPVPLHPNQHTGLLSPPLRVLHLQTMLFPWDSPIYANLVDLRIDELDNESILQMRQMLAVLSNCSELRVLRLGGYGDLDDDDHHAWPVVLKALEVLDISDLVEETTSQLLPMLSLGQKELSLRVGFRNGEETEAVQSFLSRSNVTRLYIWAAGDVSVAECLAHAPNLRVLILDGNSCRADSDLDRITRPCPGSNQRSAICPQLQSLYLIDCVVYKGKLQATVQAHSLESLVLGACIVEPRKEKSLQWLEPMVKHLVRVDKLNKDLETYWNLLLN